MAGKKTQDFGDYAETYEKIDESRKITAQKFIKELLFMEAQLEKLHADIEENGPTDNFVQGRQKMIRESPAMKSYCTLIQRFGDLQKKLADLLPEKKDTTKAQAGAKLAEFVAKGKK